MKNKWANPRVRDEITGFIEHWHHRAELPVAQLCAWCAVGRNRFYDWRKRRGQANAHNATIPKKHWVLDWEKAAIIRFGMEHLEAGYRRITFLMLDQNVVAVSASTTYRVLLGAGLLNQRQFGPGKKGDGFEQPLKPHEHWHIDFSYLRIGSAFYFIVLVLDGCSRAILSWDINETMTTEDAQIALQKAREKYPNHTPRIISDNGGQFLSKDFKQFIKICEMTHVTTSPYYPQSNGKLERANRTLKGECLRKLSPSDLEDARRIASRYIADYNEVRLHSAIGYITPLDRLEGRHETIKAERKRKLAAAKEKRAAAQLQAVESREEKPVFSLEKTDTSLPASRKGRGQEIPQPQPLRSADEVRTVLDADRLDAPGTGMARAVPYPGRTRNKTKPIFN